MDRIGEETTKVRSIEFSEIGEVIDPGEFPVTTEDLIEAYGDCVVEYPRGGDRLERILRTSGLETYETPDEIELSVLNGVRRDAVGRPRYSDRNDLRFHTFDRKQQSL